MTIVQQSSSQPVQPTQPELKPCIKCRTRGYLVDRTGKTYMCYACGGSERTETRPDGSTVLIRTRGCGKVTPEVHERQQAERDRFWRVHRQVSQLPQATSPPALATTDLTPADEDLGL